MASRCSFSRLLRNRLHVPNHDRVLVLLLLALLAAWACCRPSLLDPLGLWLIGITVFYAVRAVFVVTELDLPHESSSCTDTRTPSLEQTCCSPCGSRQRHFPVLGRAETVNTTVAAVPDHSPCTQPRRPLSSRDRRRERLARGDRGPPCLLRGSRGHASGAEGRKGARQRPDPWRGGCLRRPPERGRRPGGHPAASWSLEPFLVDVSSSGAEGSLLFSPAALGDSRLRLGFTNSTRRDHHHLDVGPGGDRPARPTTLREQSEVRPRRSSPGHRSAGVGLWPQGAARQSSLVSRSPRSPVTTPWCGASPSPATSSSTIRSSSPRVDAGRVFPLRHSADFENGIASAVPLASAVVETDGSGPIGQWFRQIYEPTTTNGWPVGAPGDWYIAVDVWVVLIGGALSGYLIGKAQRSLTDYRSNAVSLTTGLLASLLVLRTGVSVLSLAYWIEWLLPVAIICKLVHTGEPLEDLSDSSASRRRHVAVCPPIDSSRRACKSGIDEVERGRITAIHLLGKTFGVVFTESRSRRNASSSLGTGPDDAA